MPGTICPLNSATSTPEGWDTYYNIDKKFPNLKKAVNYSKVDFWNKKDFRLKLRHTLLTIREIRHELNPDHNLHIGLLADLISLFCISVNHTVCEIFNQYLLPESKEQLSVDLKILI